MCRGRASDRRLRTGELVLSARQKSAKGIVGAARTEGPNLERWSTGREERWDSI